MNDETADLFTALKAILEARDYDAALQLLDEFALNHSITAEILRQRGHICALRKDFEGAIRDLSAAIELSDLEPDYFYTRGRCFFRLSDYLRAIEDFSRTLSLCDHHKSDYYRVPAYFFRAETYLRLRRFQKALEDCQHVPDGFQTWVDQLRSKQDIISEIKIEIAGRNAVRGGEQGGKSR